jgi:hypothetical protein
MSHARRCHDTVSHGTRGGTRSFVKWLDWLGNGLGLIPVVPLFLLLLRNCSYHHTNLYCCCALQPLLVLLEARGAARWRERALCAWSGRSRRHERGAWSGRWRARETRARGCGESGGTRRGGGAGRGAAKAGSRVRRGAQRRENARRVARVAGGGAPCGGAGFDRWSGNRRANPVDPCADCRTDNCCSDDQAAEQRTDHGAQQGADHCCADGGADQAAEQRADHCSQ